MAVPRGCDTGQGNIPNQLYHYGQRYYDPTTGRWTQTDPLDQIADFTQANRYTFAGDDPINLTDPSGEWSFRQGCAILGSVLSMCGGLNSPYGSMESDTVRETAHLVTEAGDALSELGDEETSLEDELGSAGDVIEGIASGG